MYRRGRPENLPSIQFLGPSCWSHGGPKCFSSPISPRIKLHPCNSGQGDDITQHNRPVDEQAFPSVEYGYEAKEAAERRKAMANVYIETVDGQTLSYVQDLMEYASYGIIYVMGSEKTILPWSQIKLVTEPR